MKDLSEVVDTFGQKIVADVRTEWDRFPFVDGASEASFRIVKNDGNRVVGQLAAKGQKMWVLEHGKGSLMDDESENPDLSSYKQSEIWNKERENNEIRTRAKGVYYDIDGVPHQGSGYGAPHGYDAEKTLKKPILPIPPQHIIRDNIMATSGTSARIQQLEQEIAEFIGHEIDTAIEVKRG